MARIHQCDDLVEGRFVIDADRVARHHLTDQPGTHAPASRCVFFDAKQFFQPVSGWRADIELGPMQKIALRNDADKRPVVADHRQTALAGGDRAGLSWIKSRPRLFNDNMAPVAGVISERAEHIHVERSARLHSL